MPFDWMRSEQVEGYGSPITSRGKSVAYGPPPWHLHGRALSVWFRLQDPSEVRRHVPSTVDIQGEDDPVVRARFWELAHDSGLAGRIDLPPRQFREAVVAFPVVHADISGEFLTYMYADDPVYMSFGRELMGWPLRHGDIQITEKGLRDSYVGQRTEATVSRLGSTVISSTFTLTNLVPEAARSLPKWLSYKLIPSVEGPHFTLRELVLTGPRRVEWGPTWAAKATLAFGPSPNDELEYLTPREILRAEYWPSVDLTLGFGTILDRA